MHFIVHISLYLLLCLVIALIGRHRKLTFWGYFLACIIFTPLIGMVLVIASDPRIPKKEDDDD